MRSAPGVARADGPRIHPTALVEDGVAIGARTAIWDGVHLRGPSTIGRDCIIGEKTYVAYGVSIGDCVKINAFVYVCTAVTIEHRVFIGARVTFTNDRYPRAFADGHDGLAPSDPNEDTLATVVRLGATIGAAATIGPGLEIGPYAMVGMAALVVRDVPAHALVIGAPARIHGWVCECGQPVARPGDGPATRACRCGRRWALVDDGPEARLARRD